MKLNHDFQQNDERMSTQQNDKNSPKITYKYSTAKKRIQKIYFKKSRD